jgi:hypothetical protein|nr:MAG TPA_asm: tail repeat-like protein [Caudoviricetes sp.]
MIKIQNYYSEDPGKVPSKDNLDVGQLWINIKDKKIGTKDSKNVIQQWSQFDPAEKQQALNSIPKTGNIADITMSNAAKQSTGNTININDDSNVVVAHTLENGTTTITIEKTTGFKATQLVLSKPEGITAQISWVGVDHWLSTVDVPVFGKDAAAQELSVAIFSSPTSVAVNVIYNTETPIDSDITEAKWGNITGNLIDQSDLQAALSLKANASDIPDTSDVLTKTEASSMYLGISAKAASASQADSATKATQDASGNTITATYATKSELAQKQPLGSYVNKTDYDAFVGQYAVDKDTFALADDVTEQLAAKANTATVNTQLAAKANLQHTHAIADVVDLQTALDAKLDKSMYNADKATFALKADISTVYKYKGTVADINALPAKKQVGDVYNLEDTGDNVAWDGNSWDYLGGTANLSEYAKTSDVNSSIALAKAELNTAFNTALNGKLDATANAVSATKATQDAAGNVITATYATKTALNAKQDTATAFKQTDADKLYLAKTGKAVSATSADSATKATQDSSGNVITTTYATKTELSKKLDTSAAFTRATADTLYLGKTAKAASAATADTATSATSAVNATKATQDASGNVITTTYATKSEVNTGLAGKANSSHTHTKNQITDFPSIPDVSTLIPKTGDGGTITVYETMMEVENNTISIDSPGILLKYAVNTAVNITLSAGVNGKGATKILYIFDTTSVTFTPQSDVSIVWANNKAPTFKKQNIIILTFHNNNMVFANLASSWD